MTVYVINEENHGNIGIAKNYKSAIQWLIDENWINDFTECYDDTKDYPYVTLKEKLGDDWKSKLFNLTPTQFENLFENQFMIVTYNVIGS